MAWTVGINGTTPATGAVAMWEVISMLVAAGATILSCGDGSTYDATGALITSGAINAGGLGNTNAWVRLALNGGRQITIQRGTSNISWRLKYSAQSGFSGGTPSATQTPTAVDQVIRYGGGTDASPTFVNLFPADNTYRLYGSADNAGPGAWFGNTLNSNGNHSGGIILDPVTNALAGDQDPFAILGTIAGSSFARANATGGTATGNGVMAWLKYGLAGAAFTATPLPDLEMAGTNPNTGDALLTTLPYQRASTETAPTGPKGNSSVAKLTHATRATRELYVIDGVYLIVMGEFALWFFSDTVNM